MLSSAISDATVDRRGHTIHPPDTSTIVAGSLQHRSVWTLAGPTRGLHAAVTYCRVSEIFNNRHYVYCACIRQCLLLHRIYWFTASSVPRGALLPR